MVDLYVWSTKGSALTLLTAINQSSNLKYLEMCESVLAGVLSIRNLYRE